MRLSWWSRARSYGLVRWLAVVLLGAAVVLVLSLATGRQSPAGTGGSAKTPPWRAPSDRSVPVDPRVELVRTQGLGVTVGAYIENLHDLSLRQRTFAVEGYYWMEWPRQVQDLLESNGFGPLDLVEFTNQVNVSEASIQLDTPAPIAIPGDRFYQLIRYSGTFYIPSLDLRLSPFESLVLPVILEVTPEAFARQRANIILVPDQDPANSLIGAYAAINGYDIKTAGFASSMHAYGTDWGRDLGNLQFSQAAVEVVMQSDVISSFITWVLPLLIVMAIVLLAPSLVGELGDIRLAIPSTALLTLIFLQQSYKAELPLLSYLTFLDYLYAYSYVISLVLFILFLWGTNTFAAAPEGGKAHALNRINRVDAVFQIIALCGFFVVAMLAWML